MADLSTLYFNYELLCTNDMRNENTTEAETYTILGILLTTLEELDPWMGLVV